MTDITQPPAERPRSPITGQPVPERPKHSGGNFKKLRGAEVKNAMQKCRDAEILDKMIGVGVTLYNMVVARQNEFVTAANGDPAIAFAKMAADKPSVKLCEAAMHQLDKVAQYGYQKLTRLDYVGDAPAAQTVENKMLFVLNLGIGDAPGRPVTINGHSPGNGSQYAAAAATAPGGDAHPDDDG